MMRATFILVLILTLGPCCRAWAVPLESVPAPAVHSDDSSSVSSGIANGAPPAAAPLQSASTSSVPGEDPIVVGTANPAAPKIPAFPVQMYVRTGVSSRFELFFLNVKYGYAISDFQFYDSWCIRKGAPLPGHTIHTVRLYNSTDPNLPPEFKRMEWHQINYLINHKKGSKEDIQEAIWRLAKCCSTTKMSPEALRLVREANLNGKDYTPGAGDLTAIICAPAGIEQPLFLEYKIPQSIPPAVKPAVFAPMPTVAGSLSRLFIPPIFFWSGGGGGGSSHHKTTPEPSSFLLLATGLLGVLVSWKAGRRLQGRAQLCPRRGEDRRATRLIDGMVEE